MTQTGTSFYSRQTYFPYGAQRTTEGSALPTDYTFTGQKNDDSTGLMFYGARYYDTSLGRFTQPDTIVPSPLNPQSLNRFSYTLNNPVKYTDPTGHMACGTECDPGGGGGGTSGGGTSGGGTPEAIPQEVVVPDGNGGVTIIDCDQKPHAIGCGNNKTAQAKPAPTPKMPVATGHSQAANQSSKPTAGATPDPCQSGEASASNCPPNPNPSIFDPSCMCARTVAPGYGTLPPSDALWFTVQGYGSTVCVWTIYCRSWGWDVVTDVTSGEKALFTYDTPEGSNAKFLCAFICISTGRISSRENVTEMEFVDSWINVTESGIVDSRIFVTREHSPSVLRGVCQSAA